MIGEVMVSLQQAKATVEKILNKPIDITKLHTLEPSEQQIFYSTLAGTVIGSALGAIAFGYISEKWGIDKILTSFGKQAGEWIRTRLEELKKQLGIK